MTEYDIELRHLIKNIESEIIISDEQVDENGKIVSEPVLVFAIEGERIGYIPILEIEKWVLSRTFAKGSDKVGIDKFGK
jgi:hypothetical protein